MQFKVPQNIDLEDKIIGPLTMIQFIYVLVGGLIDYLFFQWFGIKHLGIFLIIGIPIGLVALALAFLKIQDQPLSHFIKAGLVYLSNPKTRIWKKEEILPKVILQAPKEKPKSQLMPTKRQIEKSELEKLAYALDTQGFSPAETQNFGRVSQIYESWLKNKSNNNAQGGQGGFVGQAQTTNRQYPRTS